MDRLGTSSSHNILGTNWGTGSSVWTWVRTSSLWGWRSTGTGCPGRLWSLLLWRYSRPAWTRSCAAYCRWPCFSRGVGLDDPQRSLPTPIILWFCDSVRAARSGSSFHYRMGRTGGEEEWLCWLGKMTVASNHRGEDTWLEWSRSSRERKYKKADQFTCKAILNWLEE